MSCLLMPGAQHPLPGLSRPGGATMTPSAPSTSILLADAFCDAERLALAGFLAGYRGLTRDAYTLDLPPQLLDVAGEALAVGSAHLEQPQVAVLAPRCELTPGQRWLGGCAPSLASTGTQRKRACWPARRRRMFAAPAWTMSHATGLDRTRWAPCWWPPALGGQLSTLWCRCWPSTGCGSAKRLAPTSTTLARAWPGADTRAAGIVGTALGRHRAQGNEPPRP